MSFDLFRMTHSQAMEQMAGIPGPEPSFPMGNAGDFMKGWAWDRCADYGRRFGGMTLVWLMGTPAIALNDPNLIGDVLVNNWEAFYKDAPHDALAPIITAENMFIANGSEWRFGRENSPFSLTGFRSWLGLQVAALRKVVTDAIDKATGDDIADLVEFVRRISYDAFSVAIWGQKLGDDSYQQFLNLASTGSSRMMELPPLQKLPPLNPMFYLHREKWYGDFEARVKRAMDRPDPTANDLLHFTLRAGSKLNVQQLANQLSAPVYFGGVFSMASAITTTLYFLAQNPAALAAIRKELTERQPLSAGFDLAALEACERLDHGLREAMRLQAPVPLFFRNASKDWPVILGGKKLPANTQIFITNWLLHRDPKHWTDPERYVPDRWLNGGLTRDPLGSGYFFPFGRGPRTCVGQEFAMFYMKLALAVMLTRRKLILDPQQAYQTEYFFAVQHPKNMKAKFLFA